MNTLTLNPPFLIRYRFAFNLKLFWLLISGLILSLLVFYIFQVNALTRENYLIKNHQKEILKLSQEKENLEINFSKFNSLTNLENYLNNQNSLNSQPSLLTGINSWEKVSQVKYIRILENQVVKK